MGQKLFSTRTPAFDALRRKQIAKGQDIDPLYMYTQLHKTRALYSNYIGYDKPLTFDEWNELPLGSKAAALFVQFFDQISLAWFKTKSFYTPEEDGISEVMQYLMKNVPIIEQDPARFTPKYIYRVAYNSMYCICHDRKVDRDRWELETSNILSVGENDTDTVDLFDTVRDMDSIPQEIMKRNMWNKIDNLDEQYQSVIDSLLTGAAHAKGVPKAKRPKYMEGLKHVLAEFAPLYANSGMDIENFGHLFVFGDAVLSAIVELPNGVLATYYGEYKKTRCGIWVTFFGPDKDYKFRLSACKDFAVADVEFVDNDCK